MFSLTNLPQALFEKKNAPLISGILRGVEREALRTQPCGAMAQSTHPQGLGSALTHPLITTDFSEALLEFITPPSHSKDDLFQHLTVLQKFTLGQLNNELLWASSMPCCIGEEADIPVAQYGNSNNGLMKTTYRVGLGHRYGRTMQTVAGVHFNFSLPNAFWAFLSNEENSLLDLQKFKNKGYFNLIRNFRRHYWLLVYLFGASPALCPTFVQGRTHNLQKFDAEGKSLYLPYATSLRMGDLGYQSSTQESLFVCYNEIDTYAQTLCSAIQTPHSAYQDMGLKNDQNEYQQLNTGLLQIENEFYSSIRPKRTAAPGETALTALQNRGVEYIEVRCLDVDPFSPIGITREQMDFLDIFLLYCALQPSDLCNKEESDKILANQKRVVHEGRTPNLQLDHWRHGKINALEWGLELIKALSPVAELFDSINETNSYQTSLEFQRQKLLHPELTPSAKILEHMRQTNQSHSEFMRSLSRQHSEALRKEPLTEEIESRLEQMAEESHNEQRSLEEANSGNFEAFLEGYYKQYGNCCR